ncbi:MAG: hypothetical protein ACM65M_17670 [Microcoleus sp.]
MGINWLRKTASRLLVLLAAAVLILGITSCGNNHPDLPKSSNNSNSVLTPIKRISEVSPPVSIQKLRQALEIYQPQVSILNPQPDQVLQDTYISVRLQVKDLPIFKDANLGLGPHLQVLLDNQPYQAVYDTNQPLELSDLEPGTHTLRVFASRPWEESFKNDGAYAQTTFHVFTKTENNNPDRNLPQLTYNQPQDTYGAEPIMLDFYLTNAPLHLIAQENSQDEILDWKIRATVNGESFTIDQWQPIYLKGFKPGKNWVQLEFIDELGNPIKNAFNNTVRLINYQPQGQDTLSKIVRGELTAAASGGIVDRTYKPETPTPEPKPTPALETPNVKPSPAVVPETPVAKPSQEPKQAPEVTPIPVTEPKPTATPKIDTPKITEQIPVTEPKPTATPEIDTPKITEQTPVTEPKPTATPEIDTPKITEQTPVTEPKPTATPEIDTPKIAEQTPVTEPKPTTTPEIDTPKIAEQTPVTEPKPTATTEIDTPTITEQIPLSEPKSTPILQTVKQKVSELMNKFRSFLNQLTEPKTPSLNL